MSSHHGIHGGRPFPNLNQANRGRTPILPICGVVPNKESVLVKPLTFFAAIDKR